ncbi:hypothetical protein ACN26Z_14835 [Verrucosispora sp. WMMD703]|uniref:hypothetical protein n=1 Tax=Verrucosispora sp. WMMD703 TaxID=3403463 RepID=UPI003B95498B
MSDDKSRDMNPDEIDWEAWWNAGEPAERPTTRSASSAGFGTARAVALVRAVLLRDGTAMLTLLRGLPPGEAALAYEFAVAMCDYIEAATEVDYAFLREGHATFMADLMVKRRLAWGE